MWPGLVLSAGAAPHTTEDATFGAGAETGPEPGLGWMRRLYWWLSIGSAYAVGLLAGGQILWTGAPSAPTYVGIASAMCASISAGRLLARRFTTLDQRAGAGDGEVVAPGSWRGMPVVAVVSALTLLASVRVIDPVPTELGSSGWSVIVVGAVVGAVAATAPGGRRWIVLAGALVTTFVILGVDAVVDRSSGLTWAVFDGATVAAISGSVLLYLHSWNVMAGLERARRLERDLAVVKERLRFAADLHDIQGHHLEVIGLKSELAARLAASHPSAALAHMAAVDQQARAALEETRAVVHGNRPTALEGEVRGAIRVLAAAGVDARVEPGASDAANGVEDAVARLFALAVREATTNVLRHSDARRAHVALGLDEQKAWLRVRNDGAAPAARSTHSVAHSTPDLRTRDAGSTDSGGWGSGTGLAALADRFADAGGVLDWDRDGDWFTVTAQVPLGVRR